MKRRRGAQGEAKGGQRERFKGRIEACRCLCVVAAKQSPSRPLRRQTHALPLPQPPFSLLLHRSLLRGDRQAAVHSSKGAGEEAAHTLRLDAFLLAREAPGRLFSFLLSSRLDGGLRMGQSTAHWHVSDAL